MFVVLDLTAFVFAYDAEDVYLPIEGAQREVAPIAIDGIAVKIPPIPGIDLQGAVGYLPQAERLVVAADGPVGLVREHKHPRVVGDPQQLADVPASLHVDQPEGVVAEIRQDDAARERQQGRPDVR